MSRSEREANPPPGALSPQEEGLCEQELHQQADEARRQWDLLVLLIHAGERALTYTERYQLASELGISYMFKQAVGPGKE
jgi:hypothetical protein